VDQVAQVRQRLKDDYPFYARNCLRIRTKSGAIESFVLNKAQEYIHNRCEEQRERTGKVRALILKGRQQGCSTYVGGRYYHRVSHSTGAQAFILTHEQEATNNLFAMAKRYHENVPEYVRPSTGATNAKELKFDALDSGYKVGTAGTKGVGRSSTIQFFHGSEVAFWPHAETHAAGILQAIPDEPGTESILESTANGLGNLFHKMWQEAESGISDYIAIFVPWYWQPEYRKEVPEGFSLTDEEIEYKAAYGLDDEQIAWRRTKLSDLKDPSLFKQEYPATAAEAFQMTNHDSFIAPADVVRARKADLVGIGPLVIGVDPKRDGTDRFSIAWRRGRKLEAVESDASKIDTMRAAGKLKEIIDRDNPAKMFIDAGGGAGIYDVLVSWGYGDIVTLISFASSPIHPPKLDIDGKPMAGYANRRAEMWGLSRDWLCDEGGADIPDKDSLQTDACGPGYKYDTNQRILLESKDEMKKRDLLSPDEWDSVVLTFAEPVAEKRRSSNLPTSTGNLKWRRR